MHCTSMNIGVIKIINRSKAFAACWVAQLLINQNPILSRALNKILVHSFLPKEIVSRLSWPNHNGQIVNSFSCSGFSSIRVQIGLLPTFSKLTSWFLIFAHVFLIYVNFLLAFLKDHFLCSVLRGFFIIASTFIFPQTIALLFCNGLQIIFLAM